MLSMWQILLLNKDKTPIEGGIDREDCMGKMYSLKMTLTVLKKELNAEKNLPTKSSIKTHFGHFCVPY